MDFCILGSLEVLDDGHDVTLGGARQRMLLALLVLHANETLGTERLIDELWGERPPATATKTVQVNISRLRKALERSGAQGRPEVIVTRERGYELRVDPEGIDAHRFERLIGQGRRELAAEHPGRALSLLEEALSLWRGPPLAEFAYERFAEAEILRLEELRVGAFEELIDAKLALGRHHEVVAPLEQLIGKHPYRERLRAQLMLALYRCERQADALQAYQDARRTLVEELGIEPGERMRELEQAILAQDPTLGFRGDGQTEARPAVAPARGLVPRHNLPEQISSFVGRERELADLRRLLGEARLVTLTGAGGVGKTRLALQAAYACADAYPGGAWFVGFADITDPGLIAPAICQAIGLVEQPDLTPAQRLKAYLRDRELLLVLDNLEQLTTGIGVLGELLAGRGGVKMLVTSREPLHLAGEQQYEVPVLEPEDAIDLFTTSAKTAAPNLIIERETAGAVCERLDRLPLAIELAASRTKVIQPAEILARLERHLPVLATGPRDAPQRQRTLQATIDWSYDLLTENEKQLFARLSVFAGGCTLQAAETVCDGELDTLAALVDRSLVRAGGGRYWMLQTLREYALDRLARSGEDDSVRHSHAQWFVELLQTNGVDTYADLDTGKVQVLLAADRENFRAALEWAQQAGEYQTVARLAAPLTRLWVREGRLSEADRWLAVARERSADYPLPLQALVLSAAQELASERGAYQESADLSQQAIAIDRQLGDVAGIVWETSSQAGSAAELGDLPQAHALYEAALQLAREHDLMRLLPQTLANLADVEIAEGRIDQARALCQEALALRGMDANTGLLARANLAYIANLERRHADAAELAHENLKRAFAIGSQTVAAWAALELAWSLAERQQPERAARLLGSALEYFRHSGVAMQWSDTARERAVRDALRRQLDDPALHTLVEEGRGMTLEQAVRNEQEAGQQM